MGELTGPDAAWLNGECDRLVAFATGSVHPAGGFAWLDDDGRPRLDQPVQTWITARMTHVFALAELRGGAEAARLVDHGLAALAGPLRDAQHGGWYPASTGAGRKSLYEHVFVVLAAASATAAGRPGADGLLDAALRVVDQRFWRADEGACAESFAADWTDAEPYRGANANMHAVEAFLAAADVTGEAGWRDRALRIAQRVVSGRPRLVEHFDARWRPLPDYHVDTPADPFRPFGTTIGHWFEWSRLLLHLDTAVAATPPPWLAVTAHGLFDRAVRLGWARDGAEGFVYTLDWDDQPVVRSRLHWVLCEAIAAAAALYRRTGEPAYQDAYRRWWDYARRCFLDTARGSWHHELDEANQPACTVWSGKPDVYHAVQAALLPQLPLTPTLAVALREAR